MYTLFCVCMCVYIERQRKSVYIYIYLYTHYISIWTVRSIMLMILLNKTAGM